MWRTHSVFTIVTPVKKECIGELKRVLAEIERCHEGNQYLRFTQFPGLHFAAFSLFDEHEDRKSPFLTFENSLDGPHCRYIEKLIRDAEPGVTAIYRNCEGYPFAGTPEQKREF